MANEPEFEGIIAFPGRRARAGSVQANDAGTRLVVDIDGFEGPLDVLLELARAQKVDLLRISILELVEQYLAFMTEARRLRLELAADYLVMAAWLAYLKSRLLLPEEETEEPSAEEMAARLSHQLKRLEAMRDAAAQLMARDQTGRDVFARGAPEGIRVTRKALYEASLYDLLKAYAEQNARGRVVPLHIPRADVYSLDQAIERLESLIGQAVDWMQLKEFLPAVKHGKDARATARRGKSNTASLFVAALELARQGKADIHQAEAFGPLLLRARPASES